MHMHDIPKSYVVVELRYLRNPQDREIDEATDVLVAAFDNQYFLWACDNRPELQKPLVKAHVQAALLEGCVQVAEEVEVNQQSSIEMCRTIIGVALWFGPGSLFLSTERQLNAGWKQFIGVLSHDSRTWWNYFLNSYGRMCEFAYAPGAKQAGWHLQLIGVLRSHRQQGIASLLINGVKVLAAQKKLSMFVECVRGKEGIYKALGFELVKFEVDDRKPVSKRGFWKFERNPGVEWEHCALRYDSS